MVIIYSGLNSLELVLEHLTNVFDITISSSWSYLLKKEHHNNGRTDIIVYIDCIHDPDFRSSRLVLNGVSPQIFCWSEKEFLLRYILTFHAEFGYNTELLTNFSDEVLHQHAVILQPLQLPSQMATPAKKAVPPKVVPQNDPTPSSARLKASRGKSTIGKKPIEQKQTERFMGYYQQFNTIISQLPAERTPQIPQLTRFLTNMTNYRYKYVMPEVFEDILDNCRDRLNEVTKNPETYTDEHVPFKLTQDPSTTSSD